MWAFFKTEQNGDFAVNDARVSAFHTAETEFRENDTAVSGDAANANVINGEFRSQS